jgi:hypothetical protein
MAAILDLEAQPHSSMPYVHIGVITDLYSRSLLSTDRLEVGKNDAAITKAKRCASKYLSHIRAVGVGWGSFVRRRVQLK